MKNKPMLLEFWDYLRVKNVWWLAPVFVMLAIVSVFIMEDGK